jgi:hypothetical protein
MNYIHHATDIIAFVFFVNNVFQNYVAPANSINLGVIANFDFSFFQTGLNSLQVGAEKELTSQVGQYLPVILSRCSRAFDFIRYCQTLLSYSHLRAPLTQSLVTEAQCKLQEAQYALAFLFQIQAEDIRCHHQGDNIWFLGIFPNTCSTTNLRETLLEDCDLVNESCVKSQDNYKIIFVSCVLKDGINDLAMFYHIVTKLGAWPILENSPSC